VCAHAEATKEIYGDGGLYAVPPTVYTNLQIFGGSAGTTNLNTSGISGTPEGKTVISQTVPATLASYWGIINTNTPGSQTVVNKDYSEYLGGSLRFWLRSTSAIQVKIQYSGVTPDPLVNIPSTGDVWQEQVIPLSSLGASAARLAIVRMPFIFVDNGTAVDHTVYIDHIRWTKPVSSLIITPATVQVNQGKSREFTVEGRDANNELVLVYPQFTSPLGTFIPTSGKAQAVILNVTSAADGLVTASADGKSISANVDVTAASLVSQFGILSEKFTGVQLGDDNPLKNSELFLFSENNGDPNTQPQMSNVTGGAPEGSQYSKIIFRQKTLTTQFQGLAVQWGVGTNPTTPVIDMSNYYNGSLRFWFKGPSSSTQLRDKLTIAVRSANVDAGKEISSVLLKDYVTFNDQWQAVVIPMSVFAQGRPYADLSRMKVLFTMSVAGTLSTATESLRTVYIDKVRWDTETPGALASIQITAASPASTMPVGVINQFTANGLDAAGRSIDVYPTWNFASTSLGTFVPTQGPVTFLRAVNSPASGTIRATAGTTVGTLAGAVVNTSFPGIWNIATDNGVGGELQVFTGQEGSETGALVESVSDGAGASGDANDYLRTTYALDNLNPPTNDSFAAWGITTGGLPLQHFNTGFLRFYVRSPRNLEISMRSQNVDPDLNHAKVTLQELGVTLSPSGTGAWQQVLLPISIFLQREPQLNMSEIVNLFVIGSNSGLIGEISDIFDVDRVEYLSTAVLPNLPPTVNVGPDQTLIMGSIVGNGVVDGGDYLVWQRNFGKTPSDFDWYAPADMNGNGEVDAADFVLWRDHYGRNCGTPGCDVADIDRPSASTQFNSSVSDDGKPNPPASLTLTWSVIAGNANAVVFSDIHDPFATVYFNETGDFGLKLSVSDGQFTSADTVAITVQAAGAGAATAALLSASVQEDFTITTPAKSEVRVVTDNQGLIQVETAGSDVSSNFARLKIAYKNDKIDYVHAVTAASAAGGGSNQSGMVTRQDKEGFDRETELLARAFSVVMPHASNNQQTVIRSIMNSLGVNIDARLGAPKSDDQFTVKAPARGTFFRPGRGEQGKIEFAIPLDSFVRVTIYDRMGQVVKTLAATSMAASPLHTEIWDGRDDGGAVVSPGSYLVICDIGGEIVKVKAVVSK
jgi:hypothetical protein